jgi:hypothetical protein
MNVAGSAGNLNEAVKELLAAWDQTRGYWRDAKAAEFGDKYIDALPVDVAKALSAMGDIDKILKKIRTACE